MDRNHVLKLLAIISAFIFLISLISLPKTHCQACEILYEGRIIDGYEAWEIFEDGCISYIKPWEIQDSPVVLENLTQREFIYVDIDDINFSEDENGTQIINFPEGYLE